MRPIYDDLAQHYQSRLAELEGRDGESDELTHHSQQYRRLAKQLSAVEHATAIQLRDQNRINDEVLRTLQRELDLADLRFASEESI